MALYVSKGPLYDSKAPLYDAKVALYGAKGPLYKASCQKCIGAKNARGRDPPTHYISNTGFYSSGMSGCCTALTFGAAAVVVVDFKDKNLAVSAKIRIFAVVK